jgi:hypothetical protein
LTHSAEGERIATPTGRGHPAPTTFAAGQGNHFRDVGTDVDPDFCGTGQTINIAFNVRVNEWLAPHKADFKSTAAGKVVFTNPLTGDTVINKGSHPEAESDFELFCEVAVPALGL